MVGSAGKLAHLVSARRVALVHRHPTAVAQVPFRQVRLAEILRVLELADDLGLPPVPVSCAFLTGYVCRKQQSFTKGKSPRIRRSDLPGCLAETSGYANLHRSPILAALIQPYSMRICVSSDLFEDLRGDAGETRLAATVLQLNAHWSEL